MSLVPTQQIMARIRAAEERGLRRAGDVALDAAKADVPVEHGDLRDSGRVEFVDGRAVVSFGHGLPDDRAALVHEMTNLRHSTGRAKYLEGAMASQLPQEREAIADELRRELR